MTTRPPVRLLVSALLISRMPAWHFWYTLTKKMLWCQWMTLTSCSKEHKHRTGNSNSCFCRFSTLGNFLKDSHFDTQVNQQQFLWGLTSLKNKQWAPVDKEQHRDAPTGPQCTTNWLQMKCIKWKKKKRPKPCHVTQQRPQCLKHINKSASRKKENNPRKTSQTNLSAKDFRRSCFHSGFKVKSKIYCQCLHRGIHKEAVTLSQRQNVRN